MSDKSELCIHVCFFVEWYLVWSSLILLSHLSNLCIFSNTYFAYAGLEMKGNVVCNELFIKSPLIRHSEAWHDSIAKPFHMDKFPRIVLFISINVTNSDSSLAHEHQTLNDDGYTFYNRKDQPLEYRRTAKRKHRLDVCVAQRVLASPASCIIA